MGLVALLLFGTAINLQPAVAGPHLEPTKLFRDTCMSGSVRLSKSTTKQVNFSQVPKGAWETLGRTRDGLHHREWSTPNDAPPVTSKAVPLIRTLKRNEVWGPIYRVGTAGPLFLITPGLTSTSVFAGSCAVVWKGEEYLKARRAIIDQIKEGPDELMLPHQNPDRYGYTFQESGDFLISMVTYRGWTALIATPKLDTKIKGAR